ncbi:MAG: FAD-dependent oxidoreductase [Beijerinckiaceae bacterium]
MSESAQERKTIFSFPYQRSADQDAASPAHHPVVIVGAGPVGLTLGIDLAQRGIPVVLLDDADRIGEGSRAICFAKKTLEIFDRLGCADPMLEKGVRWSVGKVFQGEDLLYSFDLLPEDGHKMPAFINLQQYYVEKHLVDRANGLPLIDLRWRNRVQDMRQGDGQVEITIETPDGPYSITADWLVACDGARSPLRSMLGLDFDGAVFEDQFLIADVRMTAAFPVERWFWFDPPFHNGQSALLHKQPDDIWRIDLQLGRDADPEIEKKPENVLPRIKRMLGHDDFTLEWVSIYKFQCRKLARFMHNRVIFAGDSAHQVSPFGARGANSGVQDAQNLGWKLAAHLNGKAGPALLTSYDSERSEAADENILNSTRATDFLAPHSHAEKQLRNAALSLARHSGFAKRMVNSGRLSTPTAYADSALSSPDSDVWPEGVLPGAPVPDAKLQRADGASVYLSELLGPEFTLLSTASVANLNYASRTIKTVVIADDGDASDIHGFFKTRFALQPSGAMLIRPDGHVASRTRQFSQAWLDTAIAKALGHQKAGG